MRRRALLLCVLGVLFLSVVSLWAQAALTDCDRIDQASALVRATTPLTSTGNTNKQNILTRLQTLRTQVSCVTPTVPSAPANLSLTPISSTQVTAFWSDTSTTETAFIVEGSFTGAAGTFFQLVQLVANVTSWTNGGLSANTTYYWRVKARNQYGDSLYAGPLSATTLPLEPAPTPEPTPTPPPPTGSVLFRMDCNGGSAYPACGFSSTWETGGYFTRAYQAGGVLGNGYVEWTAVPTTTHAQPYTGWGLNFTHPSGASRFARFSLRIGDGFNASGAADVWTDKFLIWGQGANDRVICHLSPTTGLTDVWFWCSKGIDAYPNGTQRVQLTVGQWERLQVEVRSDVIRVWKNNGSYAAPTSQSGPVSIATQTWSLLGVGFYQNATIGPNGSLRMAIGDFVLSDTFDPNWR